MTWREYLAFATLYGVVSVVVLDRGWIIGGWLLVASSVIYVATAVGEFIRR